MILTCLVNSNTSLNGTTDDTHVLRGDDSLLFELFLSISRPRVESSEDVDAVVVVDSSVGCDFNGDDDFALFDIVQYYYVFLAEI